MSDVMRGVIDRILSIDLMEKEAASDRYSDISGGGDTNMDLFRKKRKLETRLPILREIDKSSYNMDFTKDYGPINYNDITSETGFKKSKSIGDGYSIAERIDKDVDLGILYETKGDPNYKTKLSILDFMEDDIEESIDLVDKKKKNIDRLKDVKSEVYFNRKKDTPRAYSENRVGGFHAGPKGLTIIRHKDSGLAAERLFLENLLKNPDIDIPNTPVNRQILRNLKLKMPDVRRYLIKGGNIGGKLLGPLVWLASALGIATAPNKAEAATEFGIDAMSGGLLTPSELGRGDLPPEELKRQNAYNRLRKLEQLKKQRIKR